MLEALLFLSVSPWTGLVPIPEPHPAPLLRSARAQEETRGPEPAVPEVLRSPLEEIAGLREAGELEAARERLAALIEGEAQELLALEAEARVRGLRVLDDEAGLLGDLPLQRTLRAEIVAHLEGAGGDPRALLSAKGNLAIVLKELGELRAALELLEEVRRGFEAELPPEHPQLLLAELNLAATRKALGDLRGAVELEQHVLAIQRETLAADAPELLATQSNLASTLVALGDVGRAGELFEEVHAAYARTLAADHPLVLIAELNLGSVRYHLEDLEGARELLEHAHAGLARLLPTEHPHLLSAKASLAAVRAGLRDLGGARALQEELLAARGRRLPPGHPRLLDAQLNLAATRHDLGDLEGALELFEEVHAAQEARLQPDHPDLLAAKGNLAATRSALGDLAGAAELEAQVLAIRERDLAPGHPDLLTSKLNLAVTRGRLGDLEGASELLEEVHATQARSLHPDHPDLLRAKLNLAWARSSLGDLAGAAELEEHVLAARARHLPADHPDVLRVRQNLLATRARLGDRERARALARSLLEGQAARVAALHGESLRVARAAALAELGRLAGPLWIAESLASEPGDERSALEARVFAVLESLRLVSTSSARAALAASRDPELAELRARAAALRTRLHDASLALPGDAVDPEDWRRRLVDLAGERDAAERELRAALRERGVLAPVPTAERVAQGLAEGEALACFLRYERLPEAGGGLGRPETGGDSLLAFVVTPDARVRRVELGSAAPIEAGVRAWRAALGRAVSSRGAQRGTGVTGPATGGEPEAAAGEELRALVLDPVLELVPGARTLHVVADDFLHLVPLDALPLEGGLVGERLAVRSEATVLRLLWPRPAPAGGPSLLAFGAVDYDAEGAGERGPLAHAAPPAGGLRAGAPGEPLRSLPATGAELDSIGALFEARFALEPALVRGAAATKARLRAGAPGARFLHLATHGWFAPDSVASMLDEGAGARGAERLAALARAADAVRGFAPETLCGLALAGANRGANERGEVPGILTAEELATLDLSGCELAVLSACETNVGLRRAGQGVQSLRTALHAAGVRTAVTSLWSVDDAATRALMERFYAGLWRDGLGAAEALWRAKAELRAAGHPLRDWAGWVLSGEPD